MLPHMYGQLNKTRIPSACLKGNPLGDPHERDLYVYVPPASRPGQRFPVVLLLPGYGSNHLSILSYSPWKPNTVERFDQQVQAGESRPAIVVLPDCMTRWGGSQFIDSVGTGPYQTYLADEIIPFVDAHFPTIPRREARAVAGRSSGGFGALRLALDRPDTVAALASHAGDAAFRVSMRPMFTAAAIGIERAGGLAAFAERLPQGGPRSAQEFDAAFVLASSAAYAPEPTRAFPHVELPFVEGSGELHEAGFARWLEHDPVERMARSSEGLAGLSLCFIDAGLSDEHGLHFAARAVAKGCAALGAKVVHEEFEGGHRGTSYRYEKSLPVLVAALDHE